jgi:lysozyme family protein
MSTKSNEIINETLSIEGYYAKIKGDKGGETYCGISRVANPKWEGWKYVDKAKPLKWNQKVNNTTLDKLVQDFYLKSFYNPLKIESMDSIKISAHLYD